MKDLLIQIERIIKNEIKTANDELRKEFQTANEQLKVELRQEFQLGIGELRVELKNDIKELRQEVKTEMQELRDEISDLRETVYLMKDTHEQKFDAIFDYIALVQEKEKIKEKKTEKLEKAVHKNQLKIWNLENRVEVLEKSFNS